MKKRNANRQTTNCKKKKRAAVGFANRLTVGAKKYHTKKNKYFRGRMWNPGGGGGAKVTELGRCLCFGAAFKLPVNYV